MCYSFQPRANICKDYGLLSFAKNMVCLLLRIEVKIWVVNTARNFLSNLLMMHLKLPPKVIQKPAEAAGDLIGNKIANRIMNRSGCTPQNNSDNYKWEW